MKLINRYKAKKIFKQNINKFLFYNYKTNKNKICYDGILCLKNPYNRLLDIQFPYILKYSTEPISIQEIDFSLGRTDYFARTAEHKADYQENDFLDDVNLSIILFLADLKNKSLFYYLHYGSIITFKKNEFGFDDIIHQYKPLTKQKNNILIEDLLKSLHSFYKSKSILFDTPIK